MTTALVLPDELTASHMAAWPFKPEIVDLNHCFPDPSYQRDLTSFVKSIEGNFNPALVGALTLSKRSRTKYAIIDGQTRHEAMLRLGVPQWIAIVFERLTVEQEAELFALFQLLRRAMTSGDRFRAQRRSKNPIASTIAEITEGLGFDIGYSRDDERPESERGETPVIKAVNALEIVYHGMYGGRDVAVKTERQYPQLLASTLEVIKSAWPDLPPTALMLHTIKGVGQFLFNQQEAGNEVDLDRLATRLRKAAPTPSKLKERADQYRDSQDLTGHSPKYMAWVIDREYFAARASR